MANLYPPTTKYKIYVFNRIPDQHSSGEQLPAYALYDTRFDFDTEKQAEDWINQLGEKGQGYIILKTYHMD
jgi:hypothetical protein